MTKDWVHGVGHSPVCQILLQIVMRAVITSSPPAWTSSAGMLSTPADFPFFNDCTAASSLCKGWGGHPLCLSGYSSVLMNLHWPCTFVVVQLRAVFCPSVQHLSFFCEAFSRMILDSSGFPLFHGGQVFHQLVCPLTVVLPQIFFNLTTLISYSVFFCLFPALFDVVVHFLVFLRSFRLKSCLSQFSPFVAQTKNFCNDSVFFFWQCLPSISLAVSVTAMLKVVTLKV